MYSRLSGDVNEVAGRQYRSSRFSAPYLAHSFSVRLVTSVEAIPNRPNDRIVARTLMLCLLINEQTGKLMKMKNPCIQLEDVYCRGECTDMRLGCPRAMNAYWREIWLKRIDAPAPRAEAEPVTSVSLSGSER